MVASIILLAVMWPLELLLGAVFFPIKAVFTPYHLIQHDYSGWPFTTFATIGSIWMWARLDPPTSSVESGVFRFLGNLM